MENTGVTLEQAKEILREGWKDLADVIDFDHNIQTDGEFYLFGFKEEVTIGTIPAVRISDGEIEDYFPPDHPKFEHLRRVSTKKK